MLRYIKKGEKKKHNRYFYDAVSFFWAKTPYGLY